jgi:hypothetical protein
VQVGGRGVSRIAWSGLRVEEGAARAGSHMKQREI